MAERIVVAKTIPDIIANDLRLFLNTAKNVAAIAPRPVLIIGARNDERTSAGQTEALFAAAREPKSLRWTEGRHIEPGRSEIVADLLRIADEELPFDTAN